MFTMISYAQLSLNFRLPPVAEGIAHPLICIKIVIVSLYNAEKYDSINILYNRLGALQPLWLCSF